MGSKERRDRERQETREKILAAARKAFAQEGYEAVTMRAIAERIEYTPTTIYHHFANKQALVTELCQLDFDVLARSFAHATAITDPVERIRVVGEAYLEFAIEHPNHYRFMFMTMLPEMQHTPEYVAAVAANPESHAYQFLRLTVTEAIERGLLRAELTDADELSQILWAALHGLISLHMTKGRDAWVQWRDLRTLARTAIDALMRGIVRDPLSVSYGQPSEPAAAGAKTK